MARKTQHAKQLDAYKREFNRGRFLEETSHGILQLMRTNDKRQAWLARRLGVSPPFVSKVLEGSHNFTLETLADFGLAFGRAVHIVWGTDLDEMRIPVDEGASKEVLFGENNTTQSSAPFEQASSYPIQKYRAQQQVAIPTKESLTNEYAYGTSY